MRCLKPLHLRHKILDVGSNKVDEKKALLKQIGWTDELIEKCLNSDSYPAVNYFSLNTISNIPDHNITDFILTIETPLISNGTRLIK